MRHGRSGFSPIIALVLLTLGATSQDARAQAWVGDGGAIDLNLDYNLAIADKVVAAEDFENSGVTSHQLMVSAEYAPIDRLAVNLALPLLLVKYTGDPLFDHGAYDDGELHTTLTDLRAGVRYQVLEEPFAFAPHLGFSIPVADYEVIGNAVAGRHLKALHVGFGAGKVIGDATYVHLFYELSLVEKFDETPDTAQHSQHRSDLAFTIGHKLLDYRLDLHLDANVREQHGGIAFEDFPMLSPSEIMFHDAILDERVVLVGGGVGYQLASSLSVNLGARLFVTGSDTLNSSVFALGVMWSPR